MRCAFRARAGRDASLGLVAHLARDLLDQTTNLIRNQT
jgi:hypothetical protein